MKQHVLLQSSSLLGNSFVALATMHTVEVANFQFSPIYRHALVGDTIRGTGLADPYHDIHRCAREAPIAGMTA